MFKHHLQGTCIISYTWQPVAAGDRRMYEEVMKLELPQRTTYHVILVYIYYVNMACIHTWQPVVVGDRRMHEEVVKLELPGKLRRGSAITTITGPSSQRVDTSRTVTDSTPANHKVLQERAFETLKWCSYEHFLRHTLCILNIRSRGKYIPPS